MSRLLVTQYQAEVEKIIRYGGSKKETSIRNAFERLLNDYCKPRNYLLVPELDFKTKFNTTVFPDGTIKDAIRLEHGWWESKDEYDKLDLEIEKKFEKGYPDENILFEDSQNAVLIQHSREIGRVSMRDADALDRLLNIFVDYERPEVRDFRAAIAKFKEDIPSILEKLRDTIQVAEKENQQFRDRRNTFLEVCRQSINPEIEIFDVHEMLIQHILTEDIFTNIFHESQFHRENNIARELSAMIDTFFTGTTRRNTLKSIEYYYAVIRRSSENIANHHEKQKFLKALYENFYKAYNPKAADRLGIVYTPNEIVRFMIESADHLVHKHFGKLLSDEGVEILDPCTGTGTYVTELIEYLPAHKLEHKYKHEIHCNEMAILPYYIANLNIEFTYAQKMNKYEEFKNICLVDTLDHCGFEGKQFDLFAMSVQNTTRIQNQNERKISVIIGNPPYNANQVDENENNKNRAYPDIDKRIKETYLKNSNAQKLKLSDPYTRFFRWATDRMGENGVLAFISNSSFIHKKSFDGLRKSLEQEFHEIHVIDLGGDVRMNTKLSGTTHNVFGIQLGVSITFLVKKAKTENSKCNIFYCRRAEFELADEKLRYLSESKLEKISFDHVLPDAQNNWLNLSNTNFSSLLSIIDKSTKNSTGEDSAVFKLYSLGNVTNRDEWLYDFDKSNLSKKIKFFFEIYASEKSRWESSDQKQKINDFVDRTIKWTSELESYLIRGTKLTFSEECIRKSLYRPYTKMSFYYSRVIVHRPYQMPQVFPMLEPEKSNVAIYCTDAGTQSPFMLIATNEVPDSHLVGTTAKCLPLYRYDEKGDRVENITDWALERFRERYLPSPPAPLPQERGARWEQKIEAGLDPDLVRLVGARRDIPEVLLQKAKELRQKQTPAEQMLWQCLRANQLHDAKFRRQHNIGQYIVDFYCHAAKLVIELDGGIHELQKDRDSDRDTYLKANGLQVLRLQNEEITQNLPQVLQIITNHLFLFLPSPAGERAETPTSILSPSPAGEGLGVRAETLATEEVMAEITKLDIFHYTYAVLHHPAYRTKYELNLKREFPRLPFYEDFHQWAAWGKTLMDLHLNYETIEPYGLKRVEIATKDNPKAKLKADKPNGVIILDDNTQLTGVPAIAWEYKLGNRSALEWILDQYKEKKPKDPTIAKLFNTYKFADYKEKVIDLLQRVCTVSIRTMVIIQQMSAESS
jgi:predicted helicase/very-short-patch-repair endonuclease